MAVADFLSQRYVNPDDPALERAIRELRETVNSLVRSGVLAGGPSGGIDHAGLLNLDYASAAHTGFAGTGVANTFDLGQSVLPALAGIQWQFGFTNTERQVRFQQSATNYAEVFARWFLSSIPRIGLRTVSGGAVNTELQLAGGFVSANVGVFSGDGSLLTNIADAALSANVPLKDAANAFTAANTFSTTLTVGGASLTDSIASLPRVAAVKAGTCEFGFVTNSAEGFISATNGTVQMFGAHLNATDGGVFGCFSNSPTTIRAFSNRNFIQLQTSGKVALSLWAASSAAPTADGQLHVVPADASTKGLTVCGVASQSAALVQLKGRSTTSEREMGDLDVTAIDNTDASRKYALVLRAWDSSAREGLRVVSDGSRGTAQVPAGGSASFARVGGSLFDHFADAGNGTTVETDLYSDSVPASALSVNGDKLEAEYGGVFVSSATATRQIKLYFGGTAIFDTGALTLSLSAAWTMYVSIVRKDSTTIRYMISLTTEGAALAAYTAVGELGSLTLSASNTLKVTGQAAGVGAASNDILAKMGAVYFHPAA